MKQDHLPIVEITDENVEAMWPALVAAIKNSSFIALDCELSGLGNRKKLNSKEIDIRYQNVAEIAHQHSIISFGVSCFQLKSIENEAIPDATDSRKLHNYLIQTFNILVLRSENYEIESAAVKFLVGHGFDFNKQYSHGLPFHQGDDVPDKNTKDAPNVRNIFSKILEHEKPIVLHNGFVDLVFLYQNFYAELPKKLDTFICDLTSMFPNGIYDTKYLADYVMKLPASYLEFLFGKMQLSNRKRYMHGETSVCETFLPYPKTVQGLNWSSYQQIFHQADSTDDKPLCESFKYHGWCSKGIKCNYSHNMARIINSLTAFTPKASRKRRLTDTIPISEILLQKLDAQEGSPPPAKKKKLGSIPNSPISPVFSSKTPESAKKQGGHRAGFDAFMTGFIFACRVASTDSLKECPVTFTREDIRCQDIVNRVYLVSKSIPLLIMNGQYAKMSWNHMEKIQKIRPNARFDLLCKDATT